MKTSLTVFLLLLLAFTLPARPDTVISLDGSAADGDARLLPPGDILLARKGDSPLQLPLDKVLYATVNVPATRSLSADLPGPLASHAVGQADRAGDVFAGPGFYSLRGGGDGIAGTADACRYASKGFYGNGELAARVDDVRGANAVAGLMFRDEMDANAIEVCFLIDAKGNAQLRYRKEAGKDTTTVDAGHVTFPAWLSLRRTGRQFKAYTSSDGNKWDMAARIFDDTREEEPDASPRGVDMDTGSLVGIVLAGNRSDTQGMPMALVERFNVRGLYDTAPTGTKPAPEPAHFVGAAPEERIPGVLFRTGTFLAKATIAPVDAGHVEVRRGTEHYRADLRDLAVVRMRETPPPADLSAGSGVLLANGDFMDGDITRFDKDQVEVSNVTLGLAAYRLDAKVSAVYLRSGAASPAGARLRLVDGSVYAARGITVRKDGQLAVDDYILGAVVVPAEQVYSIQGAADRAARLLALPSTRVEGPAGSQVVGLSASDPEGPFWLAMHGMNLEEAVVMPARCAASFAVPPGAQQFVARVGVPERLAAAAGVVFILQADGREIYRSGTLTSQDPPAAVQVKLNGARSVRLSVDAAGKADLPAYGVWGDGMIVR